MRPVLLRLVLIGVAGLLALAPVVAYLIDRNTTVSGNQMVNDMRTLRRTVEGMGPDFKDVAVNVTGNRRQILVGGTVPTAADVDRLRAALMAAPIKASRSRVTFDVTVKAATTTAPATGPATRPAPRPAAG